MAYTPINWQTGDVITAEKLNKMDNGWGVENTQLFSETVTTTGSPKLISYTGDVHPDTMYINYDGVDYVCARQGNTAAPYYGASSPSDFSEYPFMLSKMSGDGWILMAQTDGEHTIEASANVIEISDDFVSAVNISIAGITTPMLCVSGETAYTEMSDASNSGKMLYFMAANSTYIITSVDYNVLEQTGTVFFIPENTSINASISLGGTFFVTVS